MLQAELRKKLFLTNKKFFYLIFINKFMVLKKNHIFLTNMRRGSDKLEIILTNILANMVLTNMVLTLS